MAPFDNGDAAGDARVAVRPKEAADLLGISPRLLWDWTKNRGLPHAKLGGVVLYSIEDLRAWVAMHAGGTDRRSKKQAGRDQEQPGRDSRWTETQGEGHGNADAN